MLESRIASLEDKLRSASVIDASELDNDVVRVGSLVNVKDESSGKSLKYTIVGSTEANPGENKLSNESPVGKALVGHKRNDEVSVQLPNGKARKLKITKIEVAQRRDRVQRGEPPGEPVTSPPGEAGELLAVRRRKLESLREDGV